MLQTKMVIGTRSLMYMKFLKFPLIRNQEYSAGSIMNHMLVDVDNMAKIYFFLPQVVQFPILMSLGIYMIYTSIGLAFIGGAISVVTISLIVSKITAILF